MVFLTMSTNLALKQGTSDVLAPAGLAFQATPEMLEALLDKIPDDALRAEVQRRQGSNASTASSSPATSAAFPEGSQEYDFTHGSAMPTLAIPAASEPNSRSSTKERTFRSGVAVFSKAPQIVRPGDVHSSGKENDQAKETVVKRKQSKCNDRHFGRLSSTLEPQPTYNDDTDLVELKQFLQYGSRSATNSPSISEFSPAASDAVTSVSPISSTASTVHSTGRRPSVLPPDEKHAVLPDGKHKSAPASWPPFS